MNDTEQATLCGLAAAYVKLQLQFEPRDRGSKAAYVELQLQFESRERRETAVYVEMQLRFYVVGERRLLTFESNLHFQPIAITRDRRIEDITTPAVVGQGVGLACSSMIEMIEVPGV